MVTKPAHTSHVNPNVSVDCVIFGFDSEDLKVLLIERGSPENGDQNSTAGKYVLPGDLIRNDENLDQAAERVLNELTGLKRIFLDQFHAFGDPERVRRPEDQQWLSTVRAEPDARVITVAYYSLVKIDDYQPQPSSFARKAEWVLVNEIPQLGFDHNEILNRGIYALRSKLRTQPVGFELLPLKFTLGQLQNLYEKILGNELDKRNFRRKMLKLGVLIPLEERQQGVPHKPAQYFEFDKEKYEQVSKEDLSFVF
ncbi:MAG: NUDIX domain-containing protein [Bacteroidia bacterium]|nr:NUDIX domain-containing protein [Bacteroidia bacterium]